MTGQTVMPEAAGVEHGSSVTLESILITSELARRPVRAPDYAAENRALVALAECMAQNPKHLLQLLTDLAVELCNAGSAGISLIQEEAGEEFFSWVAMSGVYTPYVGGRTPRHFSPCGTTLDIGGPQLFYAPARLFLYFNAVETPIVEGLVVPFVLDNVPAGTIWIVGHDESQHFDAEDVRLMTSLARFTAAALQMNRLLEARNGANLALQEEIREHRRTTEALRQSEASLRELNNTLEQRVQARTHELQRSNQELDRFAYIASHDLKAPLRAIGQLAGWVTEDAGHLLPAASQQHLEKLGARVKRMETLLDDLLAYSRAGRLRHPYEDINAGVLVADVVDTLAPPPGFTIHIVEPMPSFVAERIALQSALRNVIGNAIKHHHNPAQGVIEIHCQEQGEFVEFVVKDDGPGIDPKFHNRIFEMFQTLRPRDEVEGSGVGLSVVKKLVESRGGSIAVDSSLGHGATFRFTWPTAAGE